MKELARALGRIAIVAFAAVTLAFVTVHLVPGDPARLLVGPHASAEEVQRAREAHGLDRPLAVQYASMLGGLLRGDLGTSMRSQRPVADIIGEHFGPTALLLGLVLLLQLAIGVPLGLWAAAQRGRFVDRAVSGLTLVGQSTPTFVIATLLMYWLGFRLGWLPFVGGGAGLADRIAHAVLPAMSLAVVHTSALARLTRAEVLRFSDSDFARTARAKGLSEARVLAWHALRPAAPSLVTALGTEISALLTGAVVVEAIFGWPGLGRETMRAVLDLDVPLVSGLVVFSAIVVTVVNALTELLARRLSP